MYEYGCYRRIAWFLFLLNIPMGGMILLMVKTNSGFSYPGYIIYLSALYTFYTMGMSINNLVKYRKLGSPILSAAKVLNFVSASDEYDHWGLRLRGGCCDRSVYDRQRVNAKKEDD